jgi:hypothetical protein
MREKKMEEEERKDFLSFRFPFRDVKGIAGQGSYSQSCWMREDRSGRRCRRDKM